MHPSSILLEHSVMLHLETHHNIGLLGGRSFPQSFKSVPSSCCDHVYPIPRQGIDKSFTDSWKYHLPPTHVQMGKRVSHRDSRGFPGAQIYENIPRSTQLHTIQVPGIMRHAEPVSTARTVSHLQFGLKFTSVLPFPLHSPFPFPQPLQNAVQTGDGHDLKGFP